MNIRIHFHCKVTIYRVALIVDTWSLWLQNSVLWCRIILSWLLQFFLTSKNMHWAQSTTYQSGSQVTPEFWVLSMELALGHLASTYILKVAARFLVKLCTPAHQVPRNYKIPIIHIIKITLKSIRRKFLSVIIEISACLMALESQCLLIIRPPPPIHSGFCDFLQVCVGGLHCTLLQFAATWLWVMQCTKQELPHDNVRYFLPHFGHYPW
jgi:hypothetical protein